MEIKRLALIYFSATGTTQKILEGIADGIKAEKLVHINLTLPENNPKTFQPVLGDLVIIGVPVYGGRVPLIAADRLKQIKASGIPAVPIVLYGNREFEDALLELKNLIAELGFIPIAAGAFIGEHSFCTADIPIAAGRPDSMDLQKAKDFGERIRDKTIALRSPECQLNLDVPGRFPYEAAGARVMAVSPITKESKCTLCGTCAEICPTAAISMNDDVTTDIEKCIRCCACIKNCPENARIFEDSMMATITKWLNENCTVRKEPQVFGVDI